MTDHEGQVLLNRNDGIDVLHPHPGEQCNSDDAEGKQWVDADTADAMLNLGQAKLCAHCGEPQTLNTRGPAA